MDQLDLLVPRARAADACLPPAALELMERQVRLWRLKAELLALSQAPVGELLYLERAMQEVQALLGASQAVYWRYEPMQASFEAIAYAVPEHADEAPMLAAGPMREAIAARAVRLVACLGPTRGPGSLVSPVFGPMGLAGLVQLVMPEPTLGGAVAEELAAACEVLGRGLHTVACFERLAYQASHDALTGLANRRTFEATFAREHGLASRHETPLSLVVIDVDHFKRYNDTHGHQAGDELLAAVAGALASAARGTDLVARYGGEEFVVLLPFTDRDGARVAAAKLLDAVRGLAFGPEPVTASLGVATFDGRDEAARPCELFKAADAAMYAAKAGGRNRVREAAREELREVAGA